MGWLLSLQLRVPGGGGVCCAVSMTWMGVVRDALGWERCGDVEVES